MRTTNFLTIASATPVNRDASRARDMRGVHYTTPIPKGLAHFKSPPPAQMPFRPMHMLTRDMAGDQIGRLKVIRFHGITKAKRATWLVRCSCGDYELRRHESLAKCTDPDECCYVCKHTRRLANLASRPNTPEAREAAACRLDSLADGLAAGILGAYAVCTDPAQKQKYNVRSPDGSLVFDPGLWDRWAAEQACAAINGQRGDPDED